MAEINKLAVVSEADRVHMVAVRHGSAKDQLPTLHLSPLTRSDPGHDLGILWSPVRGTGMGVCVDVALTNDVFVCTADDSFAEEGVVVAASEEKMDAKGRQLAACGFLQQTLPPTAAEEPPFTLTPDNVDKAAEWFKETYASSTFNTCKHQKLPMMKGAPPMRIHV